MAALEAERFLAEQDAAAAPPLAEAVAQGALGRDKVGDGHAVDGLDHGAGREDLAIWRGGIDVGDEHAFHARVDAVFAAEGIAQGRNRETGQQFAVGGVVVGQRAERDFLAEGLAIAEIADGDLGAGRGLGNDETEVVAGGDGLVIDADNDVLALEPGLGGGAVGGVEVGNDDTPLVALEAEGLGHIGGDVVGGDAEVAAGDGAGLDQAVHDGAGKVDGDGEADADVALGGGEDGGIDADQAAAGVDEGAAGVARVDGGVGLDEVLVTADLIEDADAAAGGGDDAHGDGLADAEGITDGKDHIADAELPAVGEGGGGEVFSLDLDDGDIGLGIRADDLGGKFALVVEHDLELVGALDDVVVGDDVAVGGDDDTGAEAALLLLAAAQTELAVELGDLLADGLAGVDGDNGGADALEGVGVAGDDGLAVTNGRGIDLEGGLFRVGLGRGFFGGVEAGGQADGAAHTRKDQTTPRKRNSLRKTDRRR